MVLLTLKDRVPESKNPGLEQSGGKAVNTFLPVCLGLFVWTSVLGWAALSTAPPNGRRGERKM